jgi:hypothetical protein
MVSKAIYNLIPQIYPITELIRGAALEEIKTTIEQVIQYPFVKPDIGLRARE